MHRPLNTRKSGQALVELSLLLVFIAIVLVGILSLTGQQVSTVFSDIDNGLAGREVVVQPGNTGSNAPGNASSNAPGNASSNGNSNAGGNAPGNAGGNGNGNSNAGGNAPGSAGGNGNGGGKNP